MITADELLHDPKYRGMTEDELKGIITGPSHPMNEYEKLCKPLRKYGGDVTKALIQYYESHPLKPKQMKKDDIKHPYILVLRNEQKIYVRPSAAKGDTWIASNTFYGINYSSINEDLTSRYDKHLDIMTVLDWDGTVLWEREGKRYAVGIGVEKDGLYSFTPTLISPEKAERIRKIIEE